MDIDYKQIVFDGNNYNNWKYRMGVLLEEKNLKQYIEKDLETLIGAGPENDRLKLTQEEKKCKSLLVRCIHDTQLEYVKDKIFAKDMYDAIASVFERKSIAGQLILRKQLLTMKYNNIDDINEHFLKFDKSVRDLKSIGATMEEIDVVCHLILTMPKEFDALVTALETLDPEKLSLDFVKGRILDECTKRNANDKTDASGGAMNVKIVCYNCGKPGHIKSKCRSRKKKMNYNENKNASANNANQDESSSLLWAVDQQCEVMSQNNNFSSAMKAANIDDTTQIYFGFGCYRTYG